MPPHAANLVLRTAHACGRRSWPWSILSILSKNKFWKLRCLDREACGIPKKTPSYEWGKPNAERKGPSKPAFQTTSNLAARSPAPAPPRSRARRGSARHQLRKLLLHLLRREITGQQVEHDDEFSVPGALNATRMPPVSRHKALRPNTDSYTLTNLLIQLLGLADRRAQNQARRAVDPFGDHRRAVFQGHQPGVFAQPVDGGELWSDLAEAIQKLHGARQFHRQFTPFACPE